MIRTGGKLKSDEDTKEIGPDEEKFEDESFISSEGAQFGWR